MNELQFKQKFTQKTDERKFNEVLSYPTFAIEVLLSIKFSLQKSIAIRFSHCLSMSFISLPVR